MAGNWYFGVNPVTVRRGIHQRATRADVAAVNCLFGDFDAKAFSGLYETINHLNAITPAPTAIVATGGGYHAYWCFDRPFVVGQEADRDWIDALIKRWVAWTGADPAAADLARVLRVPGSVNRKYEPAREVRLVRVDWRRVYSLLDLERALPELPKHSRKLEDFFDRAMKRTWAGSGDKVAWAQTLLDRLDPARADDYRDWCNVGMALQELGADGLAMWETWSAQSTKHKPGECADKWDGFRRDGISLGTLYYLAEQDGR